MYSPETTTPNTLEVNETFPVTPENFEQPDISVEDFSHFADTERETFKNETVTEMENANNTINLDQESLDKIKTETNIEVELAALDKEANEVVESSKNQVNGISSSPEELDTSKQETEYQIENDPRFQKLFEEKSLEYLKNQDRAYFEKEYSGVGEDGYLIYHDGRKGGLPSQNIGGRLEDGTKFTEFKNKVEKDFFDKNPEIEATSRGISLDQVMEERKTSAISEIKNAIEDRKRIRSMPGGEKLGGYEEEQLIKKYTESGLLSETDIQSLTKEESVIPQKTVEEQVLQEIKPLPDGKVIEQFEKLNIHGETIAIDNLNLKEAIVFPKEISTEKLVRLYRGVNSLDESLTNQIPPALRSDLKNGEVTILYGLKEKVENLAQNPSYDNFLDYMNSAKSQVTDFEKQIMENDLAKIEDTVLDGTSSFKKALIYNHIAYPGGTPATGISPYISSTKDPFEAFRFASKDGGVVVIDIPADKLESFGEGSSEVNIKASIPPEYISAILPILADKEKISESDLQEAIAKINEKVSVGKAELLVLSEEESKKESEQAQKDKIAIQEKRAKSLLGSFKGIQIPEEQIRKIMSESETDIYTATRLALFDALNERFKKLQPNGSIDEYGFQEQTGFGESKKFDRKNTSDTMILRLKQFVERMEQRFQ